MASDSSLVITAILAALAAGGIPPSLLRGRLAACRQRELKHGESLASVGRFVNRPLLPVAGGALRCADQYEADGPLGGIGDQPGGIVDRLFEGYRPGGDAQRRIDSATA